MGYRLIRILFISIIILLWQNTITSAQLLDVPLGDELYHEVYDFIDRMVAHGYVTKVFKNTQPYSRGEVAKVLIELEQKVKEGSLKLSQVEGQRLKQLLLAFSEDLQALHYFSNSNVKKAHLLHLKGEKHRFGVDLGLGESALSRKQKSMKGRTAYATLFRPTVVGQIQDDFAFRSDFRVYYLGAIQFPDFPKTEARVSQQHIKPMTAGLTTYQMKFKLPWFELVWGKENLHWGPGQHGALLISENPLPMEMIRLTAQYYPVKFQAFFSSLISEIDRKYLSGHRLELHLKKKFRLGIAETVVYGERFDTFYLNPLQIYTITESTPKFVKEQVYGSSPDNLLVSSDFSFALMENLEFYGELLVDDFRPFAYGLRSYKNWGSKFGVLLGCYYVDPFSLPDTDVRIEYAFINQYTYTHWKPITTYTHFNSIIGHQIGTDADNLWVNLRHWFTPNFTMSLGYELERHGEGDVNKPHPSGAPDDDEWEFLSGVTESTHSIIIGASYNLIGKYSVALEYTHFWIKNALNQDGVNDTKNQVLLSGQYRF